MIFGSNVITEEILDICKADDSFIKPLLKPLEELIDQDKWFIQRYSKSLYIFHPLEIVECMDNYKIKCFVLHGFTDIKPGIAEMDIGILYTAREITDRKVLKEVKAELAKAMLTDDIERVEMTRF